MIHITPHLAHMRGINKEKIIGLQLIENINRNTLDLFFDEPAFHAILGFQVCFEPIRIGFDKSEFQRAIQKKLRRIQSQSRTMPPKPISIKLFGL